jgi:toxin CptA
MSLGIHGGIMLAILLAPWPAGYWPVWMTLLLVVIFECIRSQRRITSRHGVISLLDNNRLIWQHEEWVIKKPVWMIDSGILLSLHREKRKGGLRQAMRRSRRKLWLASDSMSQEEWRRLRQLLLNAQPEREIH